MRKLLLAIAVGWYSCLLMAGETASSAPLFAAVLNDLDDQPVALGRYRGQPLVVNFWASWCTPCRAEIPELNRYRAAHPGKLEVLAIGIENKVDSTRDFARAHKMEYPVFVAGQQGMQLMQALGNKQGGLPYTLFIDRKGRVVGQKVGMVGKADLDTITAKLLAR
ncbi:MAG TPA: TlpA disulfide reductase family protein [Macromonas sp.]|nr:TlpA disulfide reductase family protein [Macromonas sp.]